MAAAFEERFTLIGIVLFLLEDAILEPISVLLAVVRKLVEA
jgi:hypothetical protein